MCGGDINEKYLSKQQQGVFLRKKTPKLQLVIAVIFLLIDLKIGAGLSLFKNVEEQHIWLQLIIFTKEKTT